MQAAGANLQAGAAASPPRQANPILLYSCLDSLDQWIRAGNGALVRYENGGSIDRAAGQDRLAVAIALRGTAALAGAEVTLRQLGRLGLNLLTIDDPSDPLFAGGQLAPGSTELLQTAQSANILLHIDLADTAFFDALAGVYKGRMLWSLDLPRAAALKSALQKRLSSGKFVLVLRCAPGDDARQLLDLAMSLPAGRLHLSILARAVDQEALQAMPAFVTMFHDLLNARVGGEQSYKMMEKWFGRNVKKILTQ